MEGKARVSMLVLSVLSKNLGADVDPSSVRDFPLTPAVWAHFFSFHCVYQHVGHDENELNCDAFSVSDDIAANKSVCFKLVWVFFIFVDETAFPQGFKGSGREEPWAEPG